MSIGLFPARDTGERRFRCGSANHVIILNASAVSKTSAGKKALPGCSEPVDLHRPYVDDLTFDCSVCGSRMKRVPEVIDCWFDSGAMPVAQYHYPFENNTLLEDGRFPADYICEAVDQTRGWFYSLHALSTLLFDKPCYENVICLGHILDAKGEKMSKTKKNVVEVWPVLNKYGADALRWYLFTASPPRQCAPFFGTAGIRGNAQVYADALEYLFFLCSLRQYR